MRIPLAVNLESRDGTVAKDAKVVNGILEPRGDKMIVRKRPGASSLGQAGTGAGQMLYSWNGIILIIGDTLYHGASLSSFTSLSMSPTVAGLRFDAQEVSSTAATQRLMVKNKTQAWTFDKSFAKSSVSLPSSMGSVTAPVLSLARVSTTATATFASDPGFNVGDSVTVAGAGQAAYNGTVTITAVTAGRAARDIALTITSSGTTATATSAAAHGLTNGGTYTLSGANQSEYNGSKTITVTSSTTFTFTVVAVAETPATPATGSPAVTRWLDSGGYGYTRSGTTLTIQTGLEGNTVTNGELIDVSPTDAGWVGTTAVFNRSFNNFQVTVPNSGGTSGAASFVRTAPSIVSITRVAGSSTATITFSSSSNLGPVRPPVSTQSYTISGATQAGYNGTFNVNGGGTTVTYTCTFTAGTPASPATGSPVVTDPAISPTVSYTVAGSPTTPATGTITMAGTGGMVPGIAYINGYFIIMDSNGKMWHSDVDDPTSWPALNFLSAQNENGAGKAIAKSLNYLIALKEWSTEFFYNDGSITTGFAFSRVENGFTQTGCAAGDSVASVDGNLMWVSQVRQKGRGVHLMTGLQQQKVSTPDIERILNADSLATVYSYGLKVDGHPLYVLTLVASNITLVYDLSTQVWTEWKTHEFTTGVSVSSITLSNGIATVTTGAAHGILDGDPVTISGADQPAYNGLYQARYVSSTVYTIPVSGTTVTPATGTIVSTAWIGGYFALARYVDYAGQDILLHATEGTFWRMLPTYHLDNVNWPISFFMRTTRLDGETLGRKRLKSVALVADETSDIAMIRWSDDDCQTYTKYRPVDLSIKKPALRRGGSFRRRTIEVRHIGNTGPRFEGLELEIG